MTKTKKRKYYAQGNRFNISHQIQKRCVLPLIEEEKIHLVHLVYAVQCHHASLFKRNCMYEIVFSVLAAVAQT